MYRREGVISFSGIFPAFQRPVVLLFIVPQISQIIGRLASFRQDPAHVLQNHDILQAVWEAVITAGLLTALRHGKRLRLIPQLRRTIGKGCINERIYLCFIRKIHCEIRKHAARIFKVSRFHVIHGHFQAGIMIAA